MEIGLEVNNNTAEFEISESIKSTKPIEKIIQNIVKMPEKPSKLSKYLDKYFFTLIIVLSKKS